MVVAKAVGFLVASIILPLLTAVVIFLRVFAKKMKSQPLSADDYTIIITSFLNIALGILGVYNACSGLEGVNFGSMTAQTYTRFRQTLYADLLLTHVIFGLVKISVILFYKRIFDTSRFRKYANIALITVSCWMITAFFGFAFCSKNITTYWTTPPQLEDIILDISILCLPIPMILNLHMDGRRKILLLSLFMLGFFCTIAAGLKLNYAIKLNHFIATPTNAATLTYLSDTEDLWARIECSASIITACLPTMRPLFNIQSVSSIINSIRNTFSIHSLTSLQKSNINNSQAIPLDDARRSWHELSNTKPSSGSITEV